MAINAPRGHFVKLASTHEVLVMVCRAGHSAVNANATPQGDDEDVRSDFDPLTTAKCAKAREKSRAAYQNKKARLKK